MMALLCSTVMMGQSSGLQFSTGQEMPGYTLFQSQNATYLIDNCGEVVNTWSGVSAVYHPKLLPNGNIVYIEFFSEIITERSWDNQIVNLVEVNDADISPDYEVIVLPNQNYLCVARRLVSQQEFFSIGYNYGPLGNPSQVDCVIEVDRNTGDIIWLWDISDHVIQERDPSAGNYGSVYDHPELINMDAVSTADWTFQESFMINGMDYHPGLDQIVLSVRKMSEVMIIDHSTTTAEAAGHAGGSAGKGGDILYRWGNPQNYNRGNQSDRYLYYQHNPNWIRYGAHKDKMIIYNNGLFRPGAAFSTAPIIDTGVDAEGQYTLAADQPHVPDDPLAEYTMQYPGVSFYSGYTSAARVIDNGNVLITVGGDDECFELTPDGEILWSYRLFQSPLTFRVEKYPLDYPAFDNRDLTPSTDIPLGPASCLFSDTDDIVQDEAHIYMSSADQLQVDLSTPRSYMLTIIDMSGQEIMQVDHSVSGSYDVSLLPTGLYAVLLHDGPHIWQSAKVMIR